MKSEKLIMRGRTNVFWPTLMASALFFSAFGLISVSKAASPREMDWDMFRQLKPADDQTIAWDVLRSKATPFVFLCGCNRCMSFTSQWAAKQRSGAPVANQLIIVFSGDAASAKSFEALTMLDPHKTIVLCDPLEKAENSFRVSTCPSFFLIKNQKILYHKQAPIVYSPKLPINFLKNIVEAIQHN